MQREGWWRHRVLWVFRAFGTAAVAVGVVFGGAPAMQGCKERAKPLPPGECGNGVLNLDEECDQGNANSDTEPDACRTDCRWAYCGDRVKDRDEVCDGAELGGVSCLDLGFIEGELACAPDCSFDESGCSTCGDQAVSGREECDGADLGGVECRDVGFQSGTLGCTGDCTFDVLGCVMGCGNEMREGNEECDGPDAGGKSCEELGFQSGTLSCGTDCRFDLGGCVGGCGNGVVEPGEACDDGNRVDNDGCADCVCGDGTLGSSSLLSTCMWPHSVKARDLDGDGALDLVAGCVGGEQGQGGLAVHFGGGDGTFGPAVQYPLGVRITSVVVIDMNLDGMLDVVATFYPPPGDPGQSGGVAVMLGLQDGTFDASRAAYITQSPVDVAVADFDDDGHLDVVAADLTANQIHVLLGGGDGSLTAYRSLYTFGGPAAVAVADLNLDGFVDIVSLRQQYDLMTAYMGQGGAQFSAGSARFVGDRPVDVLVGSFNGDSFPDLAVVNAADSSVSVLVGYGDGQFAYPRAVHMDGGPQAAAKGFINGDPHMDLVVAGTLADRLWVLAGDGGGDFTWMSQGTNTCDSPVDLVVTDFDGDRVQDVAVACSFVDKLAVHFGQPAAPAQ